MTGMTNEEITQKLKEHADWLLSIRVSQDGWDKVTRHIQEDTQDLVEALEANKIVAHQLTYRKFT